MTTYGDAYRLTGKNAQRGRRKADDTGVDLRLGKRV